MLETKFFRRTSNGSCNVTSWRVKGHLKSQTPKTVFALSHWADETSMCVAGGPTLQVETVWKVQSDWWKLTWLFKLSSPTLLFWHVTLTWAGVRGTKLVPTPWVRGFWTMKGSYIMHAGNRQTFTVVGTTPEEDENNSTTEWFIQTELKTTIWELKKNFFTELLTTTNMLQRRLCNKGAQAMQGLCYLQLVLLTCCFYF